MSSKVSDSHLPRWRRLLRRFARNLESWMERYGEDLIRRGYVDDRGNYVGWPD